MARKHVSDLAVVQAYHEANAVGRRRPDGSRFTAIDLLIERTGECEKVVWRACERADYRGLLEYGTSLWGAWLTDKGHALLAQGGK